jgi:sugar phosphate isomerase/epimerase
MNLKVSCADSTFPRLSHETALAVIKDLGITAVDVCSFTGYQHTPPDAVVADPNGAADAVAARLDRLELAVADVFMIVGSSFEEYAQNHPDQVVRDQALKYFERFVTFARRLEAPGLTILPGTTFEEIGEEASAELAARELNRRAEIAGEAELRLAFEPHFGSVAETPARALDLIERTPDVGFALDYSHFVYQGIPVEDVDPLLSRTHHLHVRQAAPGVIQARTNGGVIDFPRIRDALIEIGYGGYFALEYQWEDGWLDFASVDCIAETANMRDVLLDRAVVSSTGGSA